MPTPFEDASATLLLADYASTDASAKINMIGGGFSLAFADLTTRTTAPMHLIVLVDIHGRHAGRQVTVEVELRNLDADEVVALPTPLGGVEAVRMAQVATLEKPLIPGVFLPDDFPCRVQMLLGFPQGLPLPVGKRYAWRLRIDGQRRRHWDALFFVPEPPKGPVFGGPAGPADIPGVERTDGLVEDEDQA